MAKLKNAKKIRVDQHFLKARCPSAHALPFIEPGEPSASRLVLDAAGIRRQAIFFVRGMLAVPGP